MTPQKVPGVSRSDAVPADSHDVRAGEDVREERRRVVIERLQPEIDGGRFPIRRTPGESIDVTADVFADGHDLLAGVLKYRHVPVGRALSGSPGGSPPHRAGMRGGDPGERPAPHEKVWNEIPLTPLENDTWRASFTVTELGEYEYTIEAWVDRFASWLAALEKKADAGQDVASELLEGAEIVQQAASVRLKRDTAVRLKADTTYEKSENPTRDHPAYAVSGFSRTNEGQNRTKEGHSRPDEDLRLLEIADVLRSAVPQAARVAAARDPQLRRLMAGRPDRDASSTGRRALRVIVDPERARFGAWYEMFPRSCTSDPSRSGTLREAEARLAEIAGMGFDVLYLPPVHPIGRTHRKGRNNARDAAPGDPGSPWAIGAEAGGHTAIDPDLGTLEDFDRFVASARRLGMDVALDIAFQASPDHPWVKEYPEWFRHRPDGSIKYAENPPKKYQDIYPFDFDTADWRRLWNALRDVFLFWISHGVKIFRVDNPHTKPFAFWQWVIADIRRRHPDAIFLSEAFTRPKVMKYLAKAGFNQSYTYFTWRNTARELQEYLTELTRTELQEYLRPNFFANTPDILHEYLQTGGRPAFEVRLILAATLAASYGIYSGFELCEHVPARPGSEEYLHSEKYEIRPRNWQQPGNLNELIARVNQIRRDHRALQFNGTLAFHATDNPAFLWFSKTAPSHVAPSDAPSHPPSPHGGFGGAGARTAAPSHPPDRVFVVANTDPHHMQHGHVQVPIWELGIGPTQSYLVEDLLDDTRYGWRGEWNYVKLDPPERMAHIFAIRA